jgi:VWFA-related protein
MLIAKRIGREGCMKSACPWACLLVFSALCAPTVLCAQQPQPAPSTPTFRLNSTLVFLDVTVLDKRGRPVVSGLTRSDFTITEDNRPQRIFSFEAPQTHVMRTNASDENPEGKAPVTIFVLDELNSDFADFAYIRDEVRNFLKLQPEKLASPSELMVIGNESLEMLQGYTRSRSDLMDALKRVPTALPYKKMNGTFFWERFAQSIDALQQIALQNKGIPGRKNIIWVGHGGPGVNLVPLDLTPNQQDDLKQYVHSTTNMLVNSRISLFVIYPGLHVYHPAFSLSAMEADADITDNGDDPFAGDINFGVFVNETGGKLFFNRNDVDAEIARSQQMGANYYTLTYEPQEGTQDGRFRRIHVILRDRNLRAITKAGYFAPDEHARIDPRQRNIARLEEAAESTIPFTALDVRVANVVRHPDTRTAEFTIQLRRKHLDLLPTDDGKYAADLRLAAVSLDSNRQVLASRIENLTVLSRKQDPGQLPPVVSSFTLSLPFPRNTSSVRVVMENRGNGRMGAAELDRKTIQAARAAPAPEPQIHHRPEYVRSAPK